MTCPHCQRYKLFSDTDEHGEHLFCMICGFYRDLTPYIGQTSSPEMVLVGNTSSPRWRGMNQIKMEDL